MGQWRRTVLIVGAALVALWSVTPLFAAQQQTSSRTTDLGARRHHHIGHVPPYEPHYYARPYYYRPYPYAVPYPFVFGFGPFWR